jgi:hypothetical protein
MQLRAQPIKVLKTHDERPPLVRIDTVRIAVHQYRLLEMHPLDAGLDAFDPSALHVVIVGYALDGFDLGFELHGAFEYAWRRDSQRRHWRQA